MFVSEENNNYLTVIHIFYNGIIYLVNSLSLKNIYLVFFVRLLRVFNFDFPDVHKVNYQEYKS